MRTEIAVSSVWSAAARSLAAVVLVGYPALVWFGSTRWSPRVLALVLLAVLLPVVALRLRRSERSAVRGVAGVPLVTLAVLALAAVLDTDGSVLAVPVAINAVLLLGFGVTLRAGSIPMIERFARLQEPELSSAQQAWCRTWTVVWCGFFLLNGSVALALTCAAPLSWWAFYNGFLAYVLIGCLLGGEWLARRYRFKDRSPVSDASPSPRGAVDR